MTDLETLIKKPFGPIRQTIRGYNTNSLKADAMAGLTVAVVATPQSMAYALVAGVPMEYGLYTLIIQSIIGAFFNSQRYLSIGPMITHSLLVASTVTRMVQPGDEQMYLQLVVGLTVLKGLIQLAMSMAKLGNLVRYVSQSVIVGFVAGAGVLIAAGQLNWLLGFPVERSASDWPGIVGNLQRLIPHLDQIQIDSILMGMFCLGLVVGGRWITRRIPGPLIAITVCGGIVAAMGWTSEQLPLIHPLPPANHLWTLFQIPQLNSLQIEKLFGGALALSLLGLMEVYSIGKTVGNTTNEPIAANRELFSQGMINTIASFFQCIPGSGSFSRSALNRFAGAKTPLAGAFNGLFVAAIFCLLAPWATYVPMACLAAILFVIAYGLVDFAYFARVIKSSRADAIVCLITFLATLFVPLSYAVFVGIFLNLALYLQRASRLHLAEMVRTDAGPFIERPLQEKHGSRQVLFLQVEGDLFFGVADELRDRLTHIQNQSGRVVIFRLKRTHSIDSTVMQVLEDFTLQMQKRDGYVLLCGVKPSLMEVIRQFGLLKTIGHENVFETSFGVFASAQHALNRAKELIGGSIDASGIADQDDLESWAYEI